MEYSCADAEMVKRLGISNPDAHKWLVQRKTNVRRTRAALKLDAFSEKYLKDMEFIKPDVRPRMDYRPDFPTSQCVVKFTDADGAAYELKYSRLKAYARAIHEATMFVYKVNSNATEVQFCIERESVERLSTTKSMYLLKSPTPFQSVMHFVCYFHSIETAILNAFYNEVYTNHFDSEQCTAAKLTIFVGLPGALEEFFQYSSDAFECRFNRCNAKCYVHPMKDCQTGKWQLRYRFEPH